MSLRDVFKKEVDSALKLMRDEMVRDAGDVWPRIFGYFDDGKLNWMQIDPAMMSNWRDKNKLAAMIVGHCFASRASVAVFMSDCFSVNLPEGKLREDMPANFADWPEHLRSESLLIVLNARGHRGEFWSWKYSRDHAGRRVFAPEPELPALSISNRFAFDLSNTSEYAAISEALLRGREGTVKQNA